MKPPHVYGGSGGHRCALQNTIGAKNIIGANFLARTIFLSRMYLCQGILAGVSEISRGIIKIIPERLATDTRHAPTRAGGAVAGRDGDGDGDGDVGWERG